MLTKKITYKNLNDETVTEDYYFNLTKAEMIEYDASFPNGAIETLIFLAKQKKMGELINAFKDFILRSYGEKTASGRFIKSQDLRDSFMASEAYSELFMEITSSEEAAAAFINGVVPQVEKKPDNLTSIPTPVG